MLLDLHLKDEMYLMKCLRVHVVNSKSFIFGADFVIFSEENMNSNPNMKLLLFTERILNILDNKSHYVTIVYFNNMKNKAKRKINSSPACQMDGIKS